MSPASDYFRFETDFVGSLRCIPMVVRYKLDTCGVKLKLHHWQAFSLAERTYWVNLPCETPAEIERYRRELQDLIGHYDGKPAGLLPIDPHPPWLDREHVPLQVQEQALRVGRSLTLDQWQGLTPLQRFVLLKLSQPGHENRNFGPAWDEFWGNTGD